MKSFMVIVFVLTADPTFQLSRIIFHESRSTCEIQEGRFKQEVTSQVYGPKQMYAQFGGMEWQAVDAECYDLPPTGQPL